jgi:uncharacterized membrane protein
MEFFLWVMFWKQVINLTAYNKYISNHKIKIMDAVHLHLISNHVPIIGAFFGILVLIFGMFRKSPTTLAAAYLIFLISAIVGVVAYLTGEGAEEVAEELPGVTHNAIEAHEEVALYTLIAFIILALISLIGLIKSKNHYERIKGLAVVTLVVAIISLGIGAYTGLTGGQIRHTELKGLTTTPTVTENDDD